MQKCVCACVREMQCCLVSSSCGYVFPKLVKQGAALALAILLMHKRDWLVVYVMLHFGGSQGTLDVKGKSIYLTLVSNNCIKKFMDDNGSLIQSILSAGFAP